MNARHNIKRGASDETQSAVPCLGWHGGRWPAEEMTMDEWLQWATWGRGAGWMGKTRVAASLSPPLRHCWLGDSPKMKSPWWFLRIKLGRSRRKPLTFPELVAPAQSVRCSLIVCLSFTQMHFFTCTVSVPLSTVQSLLSCTPVTWDLFTNRMLKSLLTIPLLLWWWLLHWHHAGLRWSGAVSWRVWRSFLSKSWVGCITFGGKRGCLYSHNKCEICGVLFLPGFRYTSREQALP